MSAEKSKPLSTKERNEIICVEYAAKRATQQELADRFQVSRALVWQVLDKAKLLTGRIGREKTGRTEFIGAYVHPNIKVALDGQSNGNRSALIAECIVEGLAARGVTVDLAAPIDDRAVPLPLEGKGNN